MLQWFSQLTLREKRTLFLGGLFLILIFGYFLLWQPFITARMQLQNRVTAQQTALLWMQEASIEIKQLRSQSVTTHLSPSDESLLSLIDKSTQQSSLNQVNKRIEPKGEHEVRVNFEQVNFTELMRWLGQLYMQYRIQVATINLERQATTNMVKAQMTLQKR